MEIFAFIGAFVRTYPLPALVIVILILVAVAAFKNNHTHPYFCTDCGRVVSVQFHLGKNLYQQIVPCTRCGNNVASPVNTGQGKTYREGGRNL
jgi:hypothetical protein